MVIIPPGQGEEEVGDPEELAVDAVVHQLPGLAGGRGAKIVARGRRTRSSKMGISRSCNDLRPLLLPFRNRNKLPLVRLLRHQLRKRL